MHSLVAVQRRNHTWQGPLADRSQTARAGRHLFPTGATPPAATAAMSCATQHLHQHHRLRTSFSVRSCVSGGSAIGSVV